MEKIDDNNYVLKIEKCGLEDSGTYSVEVENEAGKAKSSGEVCCFLCLNFCFIYLFFYSCSISFVQPVTIGGTE